jgi:chromosome segregation ATPase
MSDGRPVHANILAGPDVRVVSLSRRDLVLESDVRLTPGAGICLNITIGGANYLAGGRIGKVDATLSGGQVKYRAGVTLDSEMPAFEMADPTETRTEASPPPQAGVAEDHAMDAAQQQQLLKTALRSAEAARKELAEELNTERVKWEDLRKSLEQRIAAAEQKVDAAARQMSAGKDAAKQSEQLLADKHAKEGAAWTAERRNLQEALKQAETLAKQADAQAKQAEAKLKEADARVRDAEARVKESDGRAKDAESKVKEALARADQVARELAAGQQREAAAAAKRAEEQTAWKNERVTLMDQVKGAEARAAKASADLSELRAVEQRLQKKIKDEEAKMMDLVQENERQIEEIDTIRAALATAEQAVTRHEQEKQSWVGQKERITARLQLTEKWCADQQDLLYALRQHIGGAVSLLDGWKPVAMDGAADGETKATKNGRKATA